MSNTQYALFALKQLPENRLFQLFCDGRRHRQDKGFLAFEAREPGCMEAYYKGLVFALKNLDGTLTKELILGIHSHVTHEVKGQITTTKLGVFRDTPMEYYSFTKDCCSPQGISERMAFIKERQWKTGTYYKMMSLSGSVSAEEAYNFSDRKPVQYTPPFSSKEEVEKEIDFILDNFHREIEKAETRDEQLRAIVYCIQLLECLHPFGDANQRTFLNTALNFLLIKYGFPPVTFYEPGMLELHSLEEVIDFVKQAMGVTLFTLRNPGRKLFNFTPDSQLAIQNTAPLVDFLAQMDFQDISASEFENYLKELDSYLISGIKKEERLHYYCALGEIEEIKKLRPDKKDLEFLAPASASPLYKGYSPVHVAALMGQTEVLQLLLDICPELINFPDHKGNPVLFHALQSGNEVLINWLWEKFSGERLLEAPLWEIVDFIAAEGSYSTFTNILVPLVERELQKYAVSDFYDFANLDVLENVYKQEGSPVLRCYKEDDQLLVWALKKKKFDAFKFIFEKIYASQSCPLTTIERCLKVVIEAKNSELFDLVLSRLDPKTKSCSFGNALYFAAFTAAMTTPDYVLGLLNYEDDIPSIKWRGEAILFLACKCGNIQIIDKLIEAGCDIKWKGLGNLNALNYAIENNQSQVIYYLVEKKYFKLKHLNKAAGFFSPQTPLQQAINVGAVECVRALIELGAELSGIGSALKTCKRNPERIKELVKTIGNSSGVVSNTCEQK